MLKKLFKRKTKSPSGVVADTITRADHSISRKSISPNALKVLYRLNKAGYGAYLVGGGVRDLLLGLAPKDFDVATDAEPEEVRKLFRNCRLIGRRFRLAHVVYGKEIIEVSTFRSLQQGKEGLREHSEEGMIVRDNVYGTIEEDALRRDFTVNALYYNIADYSIVDYSSGLADIDKRELRLIGDPASRYIEDPVRMLRAVRFAAKLDFTLANDTAEPIYSLADRLGQVPNARLFEEFRKLVLTGATLDAFAMLKEFGLLKMLFPNVDDEIPADWEDFLVRALENTDKRIKQGKSITPAFLLAVILWQSVFELQKQLCSQFSPSIALEKAMGRVISEQTKIMSIPRFLTQAMRDIWRLQTRLERRMKKQVWRLFNEPRFRAAYDFLLLRAESWPELQEAATWWTDFQEVSGAQQEEMIAALQGRHKSRRRRRRRN